MTTYNTSVVTITVNQLGRTSFALNILGRDNERLFAELLEDTTCNTAAFIGICRASNEFPDKIILTDNAVAATWAKGAPLNTKLPNKIAENYSRLIQAKAIHPNVTCTS